MSVDAKEAVGFLTEAKNFFSSLGMKLVPSKVNDESFHSGESPEDANAEAHRRAYERARRRNEDKDMETEEEKKAKDAAEKEKEEEKKAKAEDRAALKTLTDSVAKLLARDAEREEKEKKEKEAEDAKECTCDAEEGEEHEEKCPMFKGAKDAELIPVKTLPENERPKNPIEGADANKRAMDALKAIAPLVAATGDKKAIDAVNAEYRKLRGAGKTGDGYKAVISAREQKSTDAQGPHNLETAHNNFKDAASQFLGTEVGKVQLKKEAVN
jgi:hypothetical protein